jgi:hypothetical protein
MKHKKVYEQPILKVIHIEISTLLTAGSSHNNGTLPSGMNIITETLNLEHK